MENLYEKIKEAKEALGEKAALIIASELPIENWNEEKLSGKSPFNDKDNTPSFLWNAKENCFKDFSTGKNYGIIDFYMDKYSCNFVIYMNTHNKYYIFIKQVIYVIVD